MCPEGAKGTEPRTLRLCTECQQGVIDRPEWQVPLQHGAGCSRRAMNVVKVRVVEQQPPTEGRCKDCGEPAEVVGHSRLGGDLYRCGCTVPPTEEREFECPTCVGTGQMESSDSGDESWWDCRRCDGTGKLKDRRRSLPGPPEPTRGDDPCPACAQPGGAHSPTCPIFKGRDLAPTQGDEYATVEGDDDPEKAAMEQRINDLTAALVECRAERDADGHGDEWDPATVDAVVRELESEDDVTVNVKLTSGPKFRAGWDAAVAHIRERFKGAARDTGGRDDG